MIRFHPSRFGFLGGFLLGLLAALVVFGPLAHFLAFVTPIPAFAQTASAPAVRIMDGAHVQLATVNHSGRLLVDTGSTSGLTDHITSVTHISGAVMIRNTAGTVATLTGTALDVNCTGCSAASVVEVDHVSSVTHVIGSARLINQAGTVATFTGTALDVNCTGCAAASVVAVSHISAAIHIGGTINGAQFHVQGLGLPGASHGGVLTIQGIAGMNPVVGRIVGAPNVGLGALVTHTGQLGVTCFTNAGVAESCGGGGATDAVNVFHQSTVRHISSETHIAGAVMIRDKLCLSCVARVDHTGALVTSATVTVTTDNVNVFHQSTIRHISGSVHIAGTISGARFHIQGLGTPGQSHGGVLSIQGIAGANAVSVSQSTALWNINHISAAIHLAGGVTDNANGALRVTGVTVFTVMGAIDHISSVTHVRGGIFLTNQAGVAVTTTSNALDVNCTGCSSAATVHISAAVHIAGSIPGARLHIQGVGVAGQSHGGVLTIQGITGMNALAISQSTQRWNVDHVTSEVHVAGALMIRDKLCLSCVARVDHTGALVTSATVTVTTDNVNVFHQSTVRHISSVTHVAGYGAFHVQGIGFPGQSHGGVLSIQGIAGMNAVSVAQSTARWNVDHVTSVMHVAIMNVAGTNLGLGAGLPIGHITSVVHVAIASHAVIRVMGAHVTGSIHVAGISNVGSGAPNTGTTQMVCHSTLAIHAAAAAPGYTQIIHLTSSNGGINQAQWRIYICSIMVVSAHAQGFSLLEGTGTTCQGQIRHAVIGSWRPEDSVVLAASGGFSVVSPFPVLSTQVPGNNLCIGQTSRTSGTISGFISYRAGP